MKDLPRDVAATFELLKNKYDSYISLKRINGRYYVYKECGVWDKKNKRHRTVSEYLGKIGEDGIFKVKKTDNELENAKEIISLYGGKVTFGYVKGEETPSIDEKDKIILKILSMNCRVSIPFIARNTGLSSSVVKTRIKHLKERYGIRYVLEIHAPKLGYYTYISFVKFIDRIPQSEAIKEVLSVESQIMVVIQTSGFYDLVIFWLAKNNIDLAQIIRKLKTATMFKDYKSEWYTSPRYNIYSSVIAPSNFFASLKNNVWHRTKETPRPEKDQLSYREFVVLKETSNDCSVNFTEIDKKYGFDGGTSRYNYYNLIKKEVIKRGTITMDTPDIKYDAIFLVNILDGLEFAKNMPEVFKDIIKDSEYLLNRYLLVCDIETPYGMLFMSPIFKEKDLEHRETELRNALGNAEIKTLIVKNILVGSIYYRRFDNMYTRQYQALTEEYKLINPAPKTSYE